MMTDFRKPWPVAAGDLEVFVEPGAPLSARCEAVVHAPLHSVWELMTDIERWPQWQPGVSQVSLAGPFTTGTHFQWQSSGVQMHSLLAMIIPPYKIGWTVVSTGLRAIHLWHFQEHPDGTHVITEQSLSGWLAKALRVTAPHYLDNVLTKAITTLKAEAERRIIPT